MFSRLSFGGLFRISEEITDMSHPHGKPITVHSIINQDEVINDFAAIEKLLNHPDVKNRKIVVFSIIGAYRRGKSFFLDYCLRYLYANYRSLQFPDNPCNSLNWMGRSDDPLLGFSWKSGVERVTSGIVIWSDIFLHTVDSTGEKLAIVVMDTQGLFDNETTPMENSRIFALSTLISSIQILNLSNLIQEDQLQYLQFATEFAKFAGQDSCNRSGKTFQNLMILVRDWSNCEQYEFGIEGGRDYLRHILKIKNNQKSELAAVRQFIHDSFENVSCALLPHPGKSVTGASRKKSIKEEEYDGRWSKMDSDFKDEMVTLIEHLLNPKNLIPKKINGSAIKCSEFKKYIMNYFTLFASDELPQTQSIYESTVENHMNSIVSDCLESYKRTVYKNEDLITSLAMIHIVHDTSKKEAIIDFNDARKMGNSEHEAKFKQILIQKIEDLYQLWSENSEKNLDKINEEKKKIRATIYEQELIEKEHEEEERKAEEKIRIMQEEYEKKLQEAYRENQKVKEKAEQELYDLEEKYSKSSIASDDSNSDDINAMNQHLAELKMKHFKEREIAELRLRAEKAERAKIIAEKKRDKKTRDIITEKRNREMQKKEIEECTIL